jgi:hypothetical protein
MLILNAEHLGDPVVNWRIIWNGGNRQKDIKDVHCIQLVQDRDQQWATVNTTRTSNFNNMQEVS